MVVMSVTISAYKRNLIRLYLQLFVGRIMSYLCYLCLLVYIVVSNRCCVVYFVLFVLVFCFVYPMVLISLDCPFWIAPSVYSNVYLKSSDQYFSYIRDEVLWTYFYIWRYMMDRLWTTHDHCLIDCCLLWLLEIALTCHYSNTSHSFIYCPKD